MPKNWGLNRTGAQICGVIALVVRISYNWPAMRRVGAFALAILLLAVAPAAAQEAGRYYPETGHTLDSRFVTYFDEHGGLEILGYPITVAFIDPETGFLIQYTQNARIEFLPGRSGGQEEVRLVRLGERLGGWETPLERSQLPFGSNAGCKFYAESGHNVCHAFLEYYESHGGPWRFGFPISEFRLEGDRIVQYFQGFRFDWYPDALQGPRVRLAPLGKFHFREMGYDPDLTRPGPPGNIQEYRVIELRPSTSVLSPVLSPNDSQEVFLVLRDQNMMPVSGAAVTLTARFPTGVRTLVMPLTDARGVSRLRLSFEDQPVASTVELEFWVVLGGLHVNARDSFRIWR